MSLDKEFKDIPGTIVFDAEQARKGYWLNQFCMSLGNIYFLSKIGATDGKSFQQMAGSMTGMSEADYRAMMIKGGRSVEGNRRIGEDGDAQRTAKT